MAKYFFKNHELVTYQLDFTCGFELSVTCSDIDGRRLKRKTFCFKTARGLANAERALLDETPYAKFDGSWVDDRSEERRKAYNRACGEAYKSLLV